MLTKNLTDLKRELKAILPEEGMGTVIRELKKHIPQDLPKFNTIIQLEARLNEANLKKIKHILSDDELQVIYNLLRDDLLVFIDGLSDADFSAEEAKKSKMGSVLYRIPHKMELEKATKCIVRLAFTEEVIIQNIELTADVSLQAVRVSEAMEVYLLDPMGGENFKIQSLSSPEQFLEKDDFSEWVFYVTPRHEGHHPLILKVAVIEMIAGKERKKEIVLEELILIISKPVEEKEADQAFQHAGYAFSFSSAATAGAVTQQRGGGGGGFYEVARRYSMAMAGLVVVIFAAMALTMPQEFSWHWTQFLDTRDAYETFLLKYPEGKYLHRAIERRDFKEAVEKRSGPLVAEYLVKHPESEYKDKIIESFHEFSKASLDSLVLIKKEDFEKRWKEEERLKRLNPDKPDDKGQSGNTDKRSSSPGPGDPANGAAPGETRSNTATGNDPAVNPDGTPNSSDGTGQPANTGGESNTGLPEDNQERDTRLAYGIDKNNNKLPNEKLPKALSWLEQNMVRVEGGDFKMGCDEGRDGPCDATELPAREVSVSTFYICRYEVTQALWQEVMGVNPSYVINCALCPVDNISWEAAQDFIRKLNRKTNQRYRLPTEAEWEYAARGGNRSANYKYSGSNTLSAVAWYYSNANRRTHPYGKKSGNELGLFDMCGNVYEWCEDVWHPGFKDAPSKSEAWLKDGIPSRRVVRGRSWLDTDEYLRVASRDWFDTNFSNQLGGFRVARD